MTRRDLLNFNCLSEWETLHSNFKMEPPSSMGEPVLRVYSQKAFFPLSGWLKKEHLCLPGSFKPLEHGFSWLIQHFLPECRRWRDHCGLQPILFGYSTGRIRPSSRVKRQFHTKWAPHPLWTAFPPFFTGADHYNIISEGVFILCERIWDTWLQHRQDKT